jgi:hypothetical protein
MPTGRYYPKTGAIAEPDSQFRITARPIAIEQAIRTIKATDSAKKRPFQPHIHTGIVG